MAGLAARASDDFSYVSQSGSAYCVGISGDGYYWVGKFVSGSFTFLQEWTTSPYLNSGTTANLMALNIQGAAIGVYFNGTLAWSGTDTSLTGEGRVGLIGYSGSSSETIHYFDNVTVADPGTSITAISPQQHYYNDHPLGGSSTDEPLSHAPAATSYEARTENGNIQVLSLTSGPWCLQNVPTLPYTVPPGAALTFDVVYQPTSPGSNQAKVVIQSNDADQPRVEVQLTALAILDYLQVTPATGLVARGHPGGPFSPVSTDYVLSNAGPTAITWMATHTQMWVTVSPGGGALAVGEAVTVTVDLTGDADALPEGTHHDTVTFTDLTTTVAQQRDATLTVFTSPQISVAPASMAVTNPMGGSTNLLLTVSNSLLADGTLTFTLHARETGRPTLAVAAGGVGLPPANRDFSKIQPYPHAPDRVLTRFANNVTPARRTQIVAALGGAQITREYKLVPGLCLLQLPGGQTLADALQTLNRTPGVLYAEPDYQVKAFATMPNDPRFSELWGMNNTGQSGGTADADIDAPEAWDLTTGSRQVIVAVIDTGVDYTHPDLMNNIWTNPGEIPGNGIDDDGNGFVDDVHGYDFVNGDADPMDDNDHGTHCSGTIGGEGNNGVGVAGVCWQVQIMGLKFLDASGSGSTADAVSCIEYATLMGAKVMNNSWGGGAYEQSLKDAIDTAGSAGLVFVAAAGNDYGNNNDTNPSYPASYASSNIVAVMSTDRNDVMSDFSNYGQTSVDLAAPGTDILSCAPGGGYQLMSGTSMATPHVSGACALLFSANPMLTVAALKQTLISTVDPTLPGQCVSGGRLNLARAVSSVGAAWLTFTPPGATNVAPGTVAEITVGFQAGELDPGTYSGDIVITCNDVDNPTVLVPVTMTILPDDLQASPTEGLVASGYEGGPFDPSNKVYTLLNNGAADVAWSASCGQEWVGVEPSGGVLAPGAVTNVTVLIDTNAQNLSNGVHTATVTFSNLGSGVSYARAVQLTVEVRPLPPPEPFNPIPANGAAMVTVHTQLSWNNPTNALRSTRMDVRAAIASIVGRSGIPNGSISPKHANSGNAGGSGSEWPVSTKHGQAASVFTAAAAGIQTVSTLNVAVCGAGPSSALMDVRNKLLGTAQFNSVSIIQVDLVTPTLSELQAFDAVIVFSDADYLNRVALGDAMADYADSGGGVVCAVFEINDCCGYRMEGRWLSGGYGLLPHGSTRTGQATLGTVNIPTHPVMTGVSAFDGGSSSFRPNTSSINPNATLVASWSDGIPLVVVKESEGIRRTDLAFFPPSSDVYSDFWNSATDGDLLMANALTWVAGGGGAPANFAVYLGTNPTSLNLIASNLTETTCPPGLLAFNTTYYWQVVATNAVGSVTGAVWQFTTALDEVRFASASYSIAENGGSALITVERENPAGGTITIAYATVDGTATDGADYTGVAGTLEFAAGVMSTNFQVPILDDSLAEANETVLLRLNPISPNVLMSSSAVLTIVDNEGPPEFQIYALLTNNSQVVDHDALTSDDRGGISVSASQVFITGDGATARFNAADLSGGTNLGRIVDGLCTDLQTETVYTLGNGSTALTSAGGTVTTLIELNGATGQPTGVVLPLSQSFSMTSYGNGIFSGYGRVVVHNGTSVYDISVPSGTVTDRGAMTPPTWYSSESWSIWGVAEYFGGTLYLTYRESGTQRIVRSRVPDGLVTALATFSNLSDMASFTVSPSRNRWYFHYEGSGQFGGTYETLGHADACLIIPNTPPRITAPPVSQTVRPGTNVTFCVIASGSLPLSYQWRKNGTNLVDGGRIAGATNLCVTIANVVESDSGQYSVLVTNAYGATNSSDATLLVSALDHFAWSGIASPQRVGTPLPATITARDEFGNLATNFNGTVALSTSASGGSDTGTLLNGLTHTDFYSSSHYTLAIVFTPNTALQVTHVRHYSGTKVSIWTDAGVLLASQNVVSTPGTWTETPLATPITLAAGARYRMGAYYPVGTDYYYRPNVPVTFTNGTVDFSCYYDGGDAFPSTDLGTNYLYLVDLRYTVGASSAIAVTPTNSGNFIQGVWTGDITVLQPATNVSLVATDSGGHRGTSTNFDVLLANDLSVIIVDQPDPLAVGAYLTNTITVANSGPAPATGVTATNFLPPAVTFVSATASQGSCVLVGSQVEFALGTLAGGAAATITVVTTPGVVGHVTNLVAVGRDETDPYAGNNSAASVTTVLMPVLSIADASVGEGNVGTTNMVFAVQLSPPSPQIVTVAFATTDGTALAGSDYAATNGGLQFLPGQTNQFITVLVNGDTNSEPGEIFFVNLSGAVNADLGDSEGMGTIVNDDGCSLETNYIASQMFLDGLDATTTGIAFDGANYWSVSGGGTSGNHLARYDASGNLLATYAPGLDFRSVFTDAAGTVYARTYASPTIYRQTAPGIFTTHLTLSGGSLDDQSSVVFNGSGTEFIALNNGIVSRWFVDGTFLGSVSLVGFGSVSGETGSPQNRGVTAAGDYWLTYNGNGILSVWDDTGMRVAQATLQDIGTSYDSAFGFSYCNGKVFAVDSGGGTWRGYDVCAQSTPTPPAISVQPANQTAIAGGTARFSVVATGSRPMSYQWWSNEGVLADATNATLTLSGVTTNQFGSIYWVVVANAYGEAVSSNATLTVIELPPSAEFQIVALLADNSYVVDHNALTGDDRGGMAASAAQVFYTGDNSTARFALADLSGGAALGTIYDALVGDLRSGTVYSLGNGSTPLGSGGGIVTTLLEHDGGTGLLNGSSIVLSAPIDLSGGSGNVGILAGYGRVVLHSGSRVYDIAVPSGVVVDIGPMTVPTHAFSESWAYWGVAEYFGGSLYLVCVRDYQSISRTAVPDGTTTTLASFSNLSDMASFTVSVLNNRWYFHYEGSGQFGGTSETIGYADAQFSITSPTNPPVIRTHPAGRVARTGTDVTFTMAAQGSAPLHYQWRKDENDLSDGGRLSGATSPSLTITGALESDSGEYSVVVTNEFGSATSSNATLLVSALEHFSWESIPSPQYSNLPFAVTITARDEFGSVVSNFTGSVSLSGWLDGGLTTNTILGSPVDTYSGSDNYTLGYAFTPNTNLTVTHVRHYFGSKVSIWTDGGALLAAQNVTSVPGTWMETPLATPIQLTAGGTYRVASYTAGGNYNWRFDLGGTFPYGTINQGYEISGDAFPTSIDSVRWWFVDLRYTVGASAAIDIAPTNSGNFTNGVWSGLLTGQALATNLVLQADDGNGHAGLSNPFEVGGSRPVISPPIPGSGGQFSFSFATVPGLSYILEFKTTLEDPIWTPAQTIPGDGTVQTATDSPAPGTTQRFYRLRLE